LPSQIAFRVEDRMCAFTASDVTCALVSYAELRNYLATHKNDDAVLVLELQNDELDPMIVMPFLLAAS